MSDKSKRKSARAKELFRIRRDLGTLPVVFTVRATKQQAEAIRRHAKERGQSVNRYLTEIGTAGEV